MRDSDALTLLKNRDYSLVKLTFEKSPTKVSGILENDTRQLLKCHNYRTYNQAYYEEIVIDYSLEAGATLNFRERFLVTKEDM